MKILYQTAILFGLCWFCQLAEAALPFAFPASVIGMLLLFILLSCRMVKVEHLREMSDFLLSNMAFFFIPAGVSMMNYLTILKSTILKLLLICFLTTVLTFGVTALTVRGTLRLLHGKKEGALHD